MFIAATLAILVVMLIVLFRAALGPTVFDRILAINTFGTATVLLIALFGFLTERPDFMDIALLYALINFIALSIAGWILLLLGSFFCLVGSLGLMRLPDFYSRVHAAGVVDSLGAILILLGLMTQTTDFLIIIKLVLILLFMMLTGPTAVHALARTANLTDKEKNHNND